MKKTAVFFAAAIMISGLIYGAAEKKEDDTVVNVLCYHRFSERKITNPAKAKQGDIYYISPELFEQHIRFMKKNGYNIIKMSEYLEYLDGRRKLPAKPVVITIDDGYKSIYQEAYPILKAEKVSAITYIYQNFLPGGRAALDVKEIKEMAANGFEFGCHSNTHPVLTMRYIKEDGKNSRYMEDMEYLKFLEKEIIEPKKYLEEKTGLKIETMAYPFGSYSTEVIQFVRRAGYRAAFSVVASMNTAETDRYALKRTMIYNSTSVDDLKKILEKKPLKVKSHYPSDGQIVKEKMPVIRAELVSDSGLNTTTVKLRMGNVILNTSSYKPETKEITYRYQRKLNKGTHVATVQAEGLDGAKHEYSWLFIIGTPVKNEALYIEDDAEKEKGSEK